MTTLHPLSEADHDDWLSLWWGYLDFYEEELPPEQTELTFARLIDPSDAVYGAIARNADGAMVGIVHWLTHPSTWSKGPYVYLEDLFVHPDARGARVGESLIDYVTSWAVDSGCSKVYWLTQRSNHTARKLYDRVAIDTGFVHYEIDLTTRPE